MAVAVFNEKTVQGEVLFTETPKGVRIRALFTHLPPGDHGFHIHRAGDLRGTGCKGACDHFHNGPPSSHGGSHGGPPGTRGMRHTGDLGNIRASEPEYSFYLRDLRLSDLFGRSVIVHADPDDYGRGGHEDSKITGHAGARIACAIIGRLPV